MFLVLSSLFSIVPFRLFLLCVSSPRSLVCSQSCLFTNVQFVCLCPCLCLRVKASCFILLVSRLMCTMFGFASLASLVWLSYIVSCFFPGVFKLPLIPTAGLSCVFKPSERVVPVFFVVSSITVVPSVLCISLWLIG